jgi:hypothetical protein
MPSLVELAKANDTSKPQKRKVRGVRREQQKRPLDFSTYSDTAGNKYLIVTGHTPLPYVHPWSPLGVAHRGVKRYKRRRNERKNSA